MVFEGLPQQRSTYFLMLEFTTGVNFLTLYEVLKYLEQTPWTSFAAIFPSQPATGPEYRSEEAIQIMSFNSTAESKNDQVLVSANTYSMDL